MAGQIKVNTDQVVQIAGSIEGLNKKLNALLQESQKEINKLANTWEGEAANATISSFNDFSNKYFQNYYDIIDNYVKFLRTKVGEGYFQVESSNTNLADAFK